MNETSRQPGWVGASAAATCSKCRTNATSCSAGSSVSASALAAGRTKAQVAHRLHLSERTVEKHVSNLLSKHGLSTRAEVVRLVARDSA
jgi:DNA-binding NarL/FixJ family response regulator